MSMSPAVAPRMPALLTRPLIGQRHSRRLEKRDMAPTDSGFSAKPLPPTPSTGNRPSGVSVADIADRDRPAALARKPRRRRADAPAAAGDDDVWTRPRPVRKLRAVYHKTRAKTGSAVTSAASAWATAIKDRMLPTRSPAMRVRWLSETSIRVIQVVERGPSLGHFPSSDFGRQLPSNDRTHQDLVSCPRAPQGAARAFLVFSPQKKKCVLKRSPPSRPPSRLPTPSIPPQEAGQRRSGSGRLAPLALHDPGKSALPVLLLKGFKRAPRAPCLWR